MSTKNHCTRYDEDFKRTLVNLYQSGGKTQAALCREYGISPMSLNRWIKQYSTVETVDGEVLTAKQVKELQLSIFEYIESFYNSKRPHGALGMLTPNQKEELFWNQA